MKYKFLLCLIILLSGFVFADTTATQQFMPSITTPQNITYEHCSKIFEVNKEKLFYLTLGAISANKFTVDEIQTNNGYIIFKAANNKYLATVSGVDDTHSILKITPSNNIYFFQPGIILNMYKYIELNINTEIK